MGIFARALSVSWSVPGQWLGTAKTLSLSVDNSANPLSVHTVPYAYVSIVDSVTLQVYAATFTDANGDGTILVPSDVNTSATFIAAIAQGYKPYFSRGVTVGIDDNELNPDEVNTVHVFPNPATDKCTVKCGKMTLVRLYDARGCLVDSYVPADSVCVIDLAGLPRGVYLLQVHNTDTVASTPLVVK